MKDATITFRLPEEEKDKLKKFALRMDMPVSYIIRQALKQYLEKEDK